MAKPESKKFTHDEVGYENPSTHPGERCGNCENYIPPTDSTPAACKGVQRPIQIPAWCHRWEPLPKDTETKMAEEKKESKKKKHAGHGFKHTHIEHHADGSHTIHHEHEDGAQHDIKHAVANLDGAHDSMQDNLGTPNPGEAEANAGSEAGAAGAVGAPAPAAGAAPPAGM